MNIGKTRIIIRDMATIQERIRKRIGEIGSNPRAVSIASALHQDTVGKILKNPQHSQTIETLTKLARGLQTSPEWLIFGIDNGVPNDDAPDRVLPIAERVYLVRGTVRELNTSSIVAEEIDLQTILAGCFREFQSKGHEAAEIFAEEAIGLLQSASVARHREAAAGSPRRTSGSKAPQRVSRSNTRKNDARPRTIKPPPTSS